MQRQGQTYCCLRFFRLMLCQRENLTILPLVEIRELFRFLLACALFTAVSGNKPAAVVKADNAEGAVRRTSLTGCGLCSIRKRLELFRCQQRCSAVRLFLGIQRRAKGTHQPGNRRTDDIVTDFPFKAPEHCIVEEGAALYHNMLSQLFRIPGTDHLIDRVLDDGTGQAGRNILYCCAVLLRLLDAAVHKDGAAGAQVYRMLCKQPQLGEFRNIIAQRHGKCLNKGAAAGGACLIEHNAVNAVILDLETLDILTADVNDKVHLRAEEGSRLKVRHRFYQPEVNTQSCPDKILAIAGNRAAADGAVGAESLIQR